MNLSWIDWSIVAGLTAFIVYAATTTRKHTRSVADFLAANRCADRYLLTMAEGMAGMGAITIIVIFEIWQKAGFTRQFWDSIIIPVSTVLALTGFVHYRYRQTRAMTLAQFFEMRYSRRFRIFAGILGWISGVVNYGVFPVVGARFFVNFCGFPSHFFHLGPITIDLTLAAVMLVLINLALYFAFSGGQIAVIVTDFCQGLFTLVVFIALAVYVLLSFSWGQISESLVIASEPGKSLIDPLDIGEKPDFGIAFFLILAFQRVYERMAWQGNQGYNCAASTPHEAKMSKVLSTFREVMIIVGLAILCMAAITFLNHPEYSTEAGAIEAQLERSFPGDSTLQTQIRIPVTLSRILPAGLIGAFAAAMLAFFLSTNNTYMHSWGSMFIQDVLCPLRKKPLSQKEHILYLRLSIIGVAIFAFVFGLVFPLKEYIWMFFVITGAIYLGGAGSVIIGGLYWKRGTTLAAWVAMIAGSAIATGTIILRTAWPHIPYLVERWGPKFPINSQVMSFFAALSAIVLYAVVSLLDKSPDINMDRLLHRGKYALKEEEEEIKRRVKRGKEVNRFWRMIGVNSHEFTRVDRGLFLFTFCYSAYGVLGFLITLILGLMGWMNDQRWLTWWLISLVVWMTVGFGGGIWLGIGGILDLRRMYQRLATLKRNILDDGSVEGDHLLADKNEERLDVPD